MITLIVSYFIAAIYFYRVIDSAWEITETVKTEVEFFIPASIMFIFYPFCLPIGISTNTIKAKHFILAITSFFKD